MCKHLANAGVDVAGFDPLSDLLGNFYDATTACGNTKRVLRDHA